MLSNKRERRRLFKNTINIISFLLILIIIKLVFFGTKKTHHQVHLLSGNGQPSPAETASTPHLQVLSQKYGTIFSFRFGSQPLVVVSSASAAEEYFTTNDIIFANRFRSIKTTYLGHDNTILLAASYGDHCRHLRRISSLEILSSHRLNFFSGIRIDETLKLLKKLARASSKEEFTKVELRSMFADLTFNTIS